MIAAALRMAGVVLSLMLVAPQLEAHAMKSAQWRLQQRDAETWESRLRLPEDTEGRLLSLQPQWPVSCERTDAPRMQPADEGSLVLWSLRCPNGLDGALGLSGFTVQLPDAVVLIVPLQGESEYGVLSSTRPNWTPGLRPEPPPVAHYLALGAEHILLGPDHLLFVLGLWALWRRSRQRLRQLVTTLTAFTVAHSITLAGALLAGWWLPAAAVEACIAASILLLAVELASPERGLAERFPAAVAFGFGLLHGFGFAGALAAIGLPEHARGWALASFNLGVEAGQLLFVVALMGLALAARPLRRWVPVALGAYGAVAAYWLLERSAEVLI